MPHCACVSEWRNPWVWGYVSGFSMNIQEFARRAQVSTASVSRAFHEPEKLRSDTREHILALARELGYYPSPSGRALKRGRHDVIGLVWPLEVEGAEAVFAQRILAALSKNLVANDLDLLVCPVDRREEATIAHARRTLQRSRCDAWILLYPRHHDVLIPALIESRKPVVCLMGKLPACPEWKGVQLNQAGWIADALRRFKDSGCKRVLFFGGRAEEPDHEDRRRAFGVLAPASFGAETTVLPGSPTQVEFAEVMRSRRIDAIIGNDDRSALAAMAFCRDLKLPVPAKVKVVGMDDIAEAAFSHPPLSTYRQPLDDMAACAVDLALGRRKQARSFEAAFVPRATLV